MEEKTNEKDLKKEAKAIVVYAFRNTFLEDIHAGKTCPVCDGKSEYSHITDEEMKKLMKEFVNKMYTVLKLRTEKDIGIWKDFMLISSCYCDGWDEPRIEKAEYMMFKMKLWTMLFNPEAT